MSLLRELNILCEAKNEFGEVIYTTFAGWRTAVKKNHADAWIDGDKDIASAFVGAKPYKHKESRAVGEWDGASGTVFRPSVAVKEGSEFGSSYYYEKLAMQMPDGMKTDDAFLTKAFDKAVAEFGKKKAAAIFADEDFHSDLASAYVYWQKNKNKK